MRDPYLYKDVDVMKNKFEIKDIKKLNFIESQIVPSKLLDINKYIDGEFDIQKLKDIHEHIFCDIYGWAGQFRKINIEKPEKVLNGLSVEYSDYNNLQKDIENILNKLNKIEWGELSLNSIAEKLSKLSAELWKVHPFREGNTRVTITFTELFANSKGIEMDRELLKANSGYVRNALVMASIGEYSEYNYLINIIKDSIKDIPKNKNINKDIVKDDFMKEYLEKQRRKCINHTRKKSKDIER